MHAAYIAHHANWHATVSCLEVPADLLLEDATTVACPMLVDIAQSGQCMGHCSKTNTILCCRQDDVEILDADTSDAFAAYYAADSRQADREVVFNAELGLAMEALPAGMTVQELWNIV